MLCSVIEHSMTSVELPNHHTEEHDKKYIFFIPMSCTMIFTNENVLDEWNSWFA